VQLIGSPLPNIQPIVATNVRKKEIFFMRTFSVVQRQPRWAALLLVAPATVLAVLLPDATISQASACTNATIVGAYGLTATGAIFAPNGARADIALLGRTLYDGQGGLTGIQIDSTNGTLERDTLAGTYTVRPDCTGSETFTSVRVARWSTPTLWWWSRATRSCSSTPIRASC
jgi:hypothetical protein